MRRRDVLAGIGAGALISSFFHESADAMLARDFVKYFDAARVQPRVTWDTVFGGSKLVVSGSDDRTVSRIGSDAKSWQSIRVSDPQNGKKIYGEFVLGGAAANSFYTFGFCNQVNTLLAGYLGLSANAVLGVTAKAGSVKGDGSAAFAYNVTSSWSGSFSPAVGDTIMWALDSINGKFYLGKNGVWTQSADPAAGTGYTHSFTPGSELWSPAISINSTSSLRSVVVVPENCKYAPPAGFVTTPLPAKVSSKWRNILLLGSDSNFAGGGAGGPAVGSAWPELLPYPQRSYNFAVWNDSVGGNSWSAINTRASVMVDCIPDTRHVYTNYIWMGQAAYNDYTTGGMTTSAQWVTAAGNVISTMRSKVDKIGIAIPTPAHPTLAGGVSGWRSLWDGANPGDPNGSGGIIGAVRAGMSNVDFYLDVTSDATIGPDASVANSAIYGDVLVHMTPASHLIYAALAAQKINSLLMR